MKCLCFIYVFLLFGTTSLTVTTATELDFSGLLEGELKGVTLIGSNIMLLSEWFDNTYPTPDIHNLYLTEFNSIENQIIDMELIGLVSPGAQSDKWLAFDTTTSDEGDSFVLAWVSNENNVTIYFHDANNDLSPYQYSFPIPVDYLENGLSVTFLSDSDPTTDSTTSSPSFPPNLQALLVLTDSASNPLANFYHLTTDGYERLTSNPLNPEETPCMSPHLSIDPETDLPVLVSKNGDHVQCYLCSDSQCSSFVTQTELARGEGPFHIGLDVGHDNRGYFLYASGWEEPMSG